MSRLLRSASSSCSYAAVALARSIFRKGADFTAAMAFEMASTNLVLELSIIMLALLGWQITLAEFVGAPIMVVLLAFLFRMFLDRTLLGRAKEQAEKGVAGRHGTLDNHPCNGQPLKAECLPGQRGALGRERRRRDGVAARILASVHPANPISGL
jgi:uncharacterized membrane protein YraQ (UPF0718 family)